MNTSNPPIQGRFVDDEGLSWYRIDGIEHQRPFFVALASDSDVWAFVSTAGSLAAGRRDAEGAFFPYETVDRIHRRWQHTGARCWVRIDDGAGAWHLWQPLANPGDGSRPARSVWKDLSGTRLRLCETSPCGRLSFEQQWSSSAEFGLVRRVRLRATGQPCRVEVLDGLVGLLPPGVGVRTSQTMSCLADAYTRCEALADGRLALLSLAAGISDRADPCESFHALAAWQVGPEGLPQAPTTLLSDHQVAAFGAGQPLQPEPRTRGRRGAYLSRFDAEVDAVGLVWYQVVDAPLSQRDADALRARRARGRPSAAEIEAALDANTRGLDDLLACADGLQQSANPMAAAHHRANVLFNIMRGGVFADGTRWQRERFLDGLRSRHRGLAQRWEPVIRAWPERFEREQAIAWLREAGGEQGERLALGYLPLTFSRRHGDPSRPWNRFSIRVRDAQGRRVLHHEGNWRDIFQNWEALAASEPAYLGSMIATFLGAMTPDGHNPYRIGSQGVDWEVVDPEDPWSQIGYWGDHQVIYLLRLLEAAHAVDPGLLPTWWDRALFAFADVPYRLHPHARQLADPKHTIAFDQAAHEAALQRAERLGSDGRLVCDAAGLPVLATLGEKLALVLLAKAGSLVPGGGLWLHTQRPEWNDANNALVGQGLSVVTLANLRRLLDFIESLPGTDQPFALPAATLNAVQALTAQAVATPVAACADPVARRAYLEASGAWLDPWREAAYLGQAGRTMARAPQGLLPDLVRALRPLVDATLARPRRDDGLVHAYNLLELAPAAEGAAEAGVSALAPMLEGQVAMLGSGALTPAQAVELLDALFASELHDPRRRSFVLYPDHELPGFLDRNRLDDEAMTLPVVQEILASGREDLLQRQADGVLRFAPALTGRQAVLDALAQGGTLQAPTEPLVQAYERLLDHRAFTGRSGSMFAYEGLGCIYWHMVAKLALAVQEQVFAAADAGAPELPALCAHYRAVRDGLGWRKTPAEYGAFPMDPYSHTPGEGGAEQPGMTGQVKEEILTRWGELGLRCQGGRVRIDPVLLDADELPEGGALRFTWRRIPCTWRRGQVTRVRVRTDSGWQDCPERSFDPQGVLEIEALVAFVPTLPSPSVPAATAAQPPTRAPTP